MPFPNFIGMLNKAPYGAYAMDMERRIIFWNRSAERLTGFKEAQVLGRQCYEVLYGIPEQPVAPDCTGGCFTLTLTEAERIAPVAHVRMRCSSGKRMRVAVMTLAVPETATGPAVLLHLFHESELGAWRENSVVRGGRRLGLRASKGSSKDGSLTPREWEIVELLAEGYDTKAIAGHLHLSIHTVRNYLRNAREKLHAPTRLALVLTAQRLGLPQPPERAETA